MTAKQSVSAAVRELESALDILKDHYHVTWTEKGFRALYYLARLARQAQRKAKP